MKKTTLVALLLSIMGVQAQTPTCPKTVGTELVANGDFSAGNIGFTNDYMYTVGGISPAQYSIGPSPTSKNAYFANIKDHTSGTGQMMIIDADNIVGKDLYRTTVNVIAGRTYFFSAWIANISTVTVCCNTNPPIFQNSPKLRFSIEGVTLGSAVRVDSTTNEWRQHYVLWTALTSGPIDIAIENLNNLVNGNDLALDDISFKAGCNGIVDLSALGQKSALPKTVYNCNETFPLQLDTKLSNAKYAFNWYKQNSTESIGIQPQDQKTSQSSSSFSVNIDPSHGTKYYVCYDSLGDGFTCPRLDSVEFRNEFNFDLGNSKIVCPPIYEVLSPVIGNVASYQYQKWNNGSFTIEQTGSNMVAPLTIRSAGTYILTATHNKLACGTYVDTIRIDTLPYAHIGGITKSCNESDGIATLTAKTFGTDVNLIDGNPNLSWFKTSEGDTALATTTSAAPVFVNNTELVTTSLCSSGGLYLQDNNSFTSKILMQDPCPSSAFTAVLPSAYVYAIASSVNFDLSSIKIHPKSNNSLGESISYQINLYSNTVLLQTIGNAAPLYASQITTALVSNTSFSDSKFLIIKGIEGIPAGSYYMTIKAFVTGAPSNIRELGSKTCTGTVANFQDPRGLVRITNLYEYTIPKSNLVGSIFGIDIHIGSKRPCPRQWICSQCVVITDQNDFTTEQAVTVYPNPAEDLVTIDLKSREPYTYSLSNMYGQQLLNVAKKIVGSTQMDVSSYPTGTYLLNIKTADKSSNHLLIVE